jgi:hypothetical protein
MNHQSKQSGITRRSVLKFLLLGAGSAALYLMLFQYADHLTWLAAHTRGEHQLYALIPVVIALVFSLVHGAFTGHFWDLMGLKPRGQ